MIDAEMLNTGAEMFNTAKQKIQDTYCNETGDMAENRKQQLITIRNLLPDPDYDDLCSNRLHVDC